MDTPSSPVHEPASDLIRDLVAALEARQQELDETQRALVASEQYRRAYQKGKYALYAYGGEIQQAAMEHLPCSEGPLEQWVFWHVLLPQYRAVMDDFQVTATELEAARLLRNEHEQKA